VLFRSALGSRASGNPRPKQIGPRFPRKPARPEPGEEPDSQFFTVPTVYRISVTMSTIILPIWLFADRKQPVIRSERAAYEAVLK